MEEAPFRAQLRARVADKKSMPVRRWLLPLATVHVVTVTIAIITPILLVRCLLISTWLTTIGLGYLLSRKLPFILPEGEKFHNYLHGQLEMEAKELLDRIELLEKTAVTDPLTGLLNRRGGTAAAMMHIARSQRKRLNVSLLFLDLDDFKKVNDEFGHIVGDLVLMKVAEVLRTHLRVSDSLVRWGGEEFVVVLPDADLDGAIVVAHKLRTAIEALRFPSGLRVTASFGCAVVIKGDFDKAIVEADRQAYVAKSAGKNTVRPISRKKLLDLVSERH